jgi:hypothetical protein
MSIGNIKGFFTDVVKNLFIVLIVSYLGGATLTLKNTDPSRLPINIKQYPYVDDGKEKTDLISLDLFTQFGFPYTMINDKKNDPVNDVKVWLALTCATFFIYLRKLFLLFIKNINHAYSSKIGNPFFYYGPALLFYFLYHHPSFMVGVFFFLVFLCAIWLENYLILFSPLFFPWMVYRGQEASIMKLILACIFFWVGIFFIPFYLGWWYLLANVGVLYVIVFYLFSPFFNGFHNVFQEARKHTVGLTFIFMVLTYYSATVDITSAIIKSGMFAACLVNIGYWFYSSHYSKK